MDGMDIGLAQELFRPGARHAADERQRLEHTRVIEGDHGQGCGPIDLQSGTVVVNVPDAVLPARPRVEDADGGDEDLPEL